MPHAVGNENDVAVRIVGRLHVVVVRRLVGDLRDACRVALAKAADFVELPVVHAVAMHDGRRTRDHREHGFRSRPVNRGIAHGDRVRAALKLPAGNAVLRLGCEISQHAVGIDDVEIAAAPRELDVAAMIGEDRSDRSEILGHRKLRDEHDRVRNRLDHLRGLVAGHAMRRAIGRERRIRTGTASQGHDKPTRRDRISFHGMAFVLWDFLMRRVHTTQSPGKCCIHVVASA